MWQQRAYLGVMGVGIGENAGVNEDLQQRLTDARERLRELTTDLRRDTMQAWRAAWEQQLQAERDLAAARGEQYAKVIDIGPRWDIGAPLPHLISNGSRAFVVCAWPAILTRTGMARMCAWCHPLTRTRRRWW